VRKAGVALVGRPVVSGKAWRSGSGMVEMRPVAGATLRSGGVHVGDIEVPQSRRRGRWAVDGGCGCGAPSPENCCRPLPAIVVINPVVAVSFADAMLFVSAMYMLRLPSMASAVGRSSG